MASSFGLLRTELKAKLYKMSGCFSSPSDKPNGIATREAEKVEVSIGNLNKVARIMKEALPENAKIAKEAKECMQDCVSEFISFITSEGR